MTNAQLEARVDDLEAKVNRQLGEIREQLARSSGVSAHEEQRQPWWARAVGIFKDDPAFDEAERLSKEYRKRQMRRFYNGAHGF